MTIENWLNSKKKDYKTGLALYEGLPNCNKFFLQAIQKESPQNLMKLKYQLDKNKHLVKLPVVIPEEKNNKKVILSKSEPSYKPTVQIKDLPLELHPVYITQKSNFQTACSLKMQLNALAEHEIAHKALGIIMQIESLFTSIKQAWKIIDYYLDHGEVIEPDEKELKNLSPVQLINKKNSLRSSITRQRARKLQLEEKLKTAVLRNEKLKIEEKVLKSEKKLLTMQATLSQIINTLGES